MVPAHTVGSPIHSPRLLDLGCLILAVNRQIGLADMCNVSPSSQATASLRRRHLFHVTLLLCSCPKGRLDLPAARGLGEPAAHHPRGQGCIILGHMPLGETHLPCAALSRLAPGPSQRRLRAAWQSGAVPLLFLPGWLPRDLLVYTYIYRGVLVIRPHPPATPVYDGGAQLACRQRRRREREASGGWVCQRNMWVTRCQGLPKTSC